MARFTGKWTEDIGLQLWKNISLDINKVSQQLAYEYRDSAYSQLKAWESRVYDVISDPLPKSEWHRKRDPSRLFPYLNTGRQKNSVHSGVNFKVTGNGRFSISSWAKIETIYSEFTNQGYARRNDGIKPNWIGWLNDVFHGTRGFYSVEDVFHYLALEREML